MNYKVEAWSWCADYCKKNQWNPHDSYFWNKANLEYRRQHNIFEAGDKVVFRECSGIGGASDAIDLMTVKSIDAFGVRMTNSLCPWAIQIRHATDEEIKAGKRLEVKSEN